MNVDVQSERLVIISDLHIGNPFCEISDDLIAFMHQVREEGYDLCINGDGFDIMQTSVTQMINELPSFIGAMRRYHRDGQNIFYVVGNHDLPLEEMISAFEGITFCPFVNLTSGNQRIRIEHGYLYDPDFVKNPERYEKLVHLAGYFLKVAPKLYNVWIRYEKFKNRKQTDHDGLDGEPREFFIAVKELCDRGFDSVIFGHTHHPGSVIEEGLSYHNTGSFMIEPTYALVESGNITLRQWQKGKPIGGYV